MGEKNTNVPLDLKTSDLVFNTSAYSHKTRSHGNHLRFKTKRDQQEALVLNYSPNSKFFERLVQFCVLVGKGFIGLAPVILHDLMLGSDPVNIRMVKKFLQFAQKAEQTIYGNTLHPPISTNTAAVSSEDVSNVEETVRLKGTNLNGLFWATGQYYKNDYEAFPCINPEPSQSIRTQPVHRADFNKERSTIKRRKCMISPESLSLENGNCCNQPISTKKKLKLSKKRNSRLDVPPLLSYLGLTRVPAAPHAANWNQHVCNVCYLQFNRRDNLQKHKRYIHKINPYNDEPIHVEWKCTECCPAKKFAASSYLRTHSKKFHTGLSTIN